MLQIYPLENHNLNIYLLKEIFNLIYQFISEGFYTLYIQNLLLGEMASK